MSTTIPRGNLLKVFALQVSIDVKASKSAATSAEQDITVTGVEVGDIVLAVNKPSLSAGIGVVNARVKSANTVDHHLHERHGWRCRSGCRDLYPGHRPT